MTRPVQRRGFTLIETLVGALLLSLSLAAMITLWSLARNLTNRSRDLAEHIAVARREAERDKAFLFKGIFLDATGPFTAVNPKRTDYDAQGNVLATNLAANAAPTSGAYYRAVSTYTLAVTTSTANPPTGSEADPKKRLGIQTIQVYPLSGASFSTTSSYSMAVFYTSAGV